LFDEFWVPFRKLAPIYQSLLGNYAMLPAFWIWDVDPKRSESGWAPHRDKGRVALYPDGSPKAISTWIPLTAATPLNGCMYLVPAQHDKNYNTPEENTHQFEVQSVRALPGVPGDVFMWNQAILHWGSKTSRFATESRISMSVEFQRGDIPPLQKGLLLNPQAVLPFETRLKLIAIQIMQYKHMYKILPEVESIANELIGRPL
jgi:ectoine hydroxylase-related dioxygenase (phytanoyl-CoA dioxygenase family)